jgi:type IV pilus assembly protein PilV
MARSMATVASYSILDAMRADLTSVEANAYSQTVTADSCPTAGNTLASVQLNQWCQQLGASLGAVATTQGTIQCGGTAQCTVTITFDDSRASNNGVASSTKTVTIKTVAQL